MTIHSDWDAGKSFDRWLAYVNTLPWKKKHLDESSWFSFLRAKSLSVDPLVAVEIVARLIDQAGDAIKADKLISQIVRAYGLECPPSKERIPSTAIKPEPLNWSLIHALADQAAGVTPALLKAHSPVSVDATPSAYLSRLLEPGEAAVIFDCEKSQGQTVWRHGINLQRFVGGRKNGVWFLIQPVDGRYHWNPRRQHFSRRSEESITAWRYLLLESDKVKPASWLQILVQLPLPIVSITDSGGTSRHALVRVEAASKAEWDERRDVLKPLVTRLGACLSSLTAVRLSRLPNCDRGPRLQELLWLDPQADGRPILQKIL